MKLSFAQLLCSGLALSASLSHASSLYFNGPIITMKEGSQASAVLVADGKIQQLGSYKTLLSQCGKDCNKVDLKGRTLMPSFIDAHGHYSMTLDYLAFANVASPPVGPAKTVADIVELMKTDANSHAKPWILGAGYDDSLLAEKDHPTRHDLDKVSTERPVFIRHVSGHLGVCNTLCLEMAGIKSDSPNPEGGVYRREAGSQQPNGVLEENALASVVPLFPEASFEEKLQRLDTLDQYYAQYGITSVQDGATSTAGLEFLHEAAKQKKLKLDVIAYPYYAWADFAKFPPSSGPKQEYSNHFRIAGVKMVLDGSPQGKTAWLAHPYHKPPHGQDSKYAGYPILKDEQLKESLGKFYKNGWQVLAHTNGDAAAEQMLRTMAELKAEGLHQDRSVMIHAQTVREDQIDRMTGLGIIPSFFVSHTFYWGDWHRDSVLGLERASRISPLRSATNKGVRYTVHNDTPIVPPDMALLLWTAVNRQTRSGQTLGKAQQANVMEALKAMTIDAAYQHYEEDRKGSIEAGKLADLVILDRNPLMIPAIQLRDIKVLQTIKEGEVVYQNADY